MPPVQLSSLFGISEDDIKLHIHSLKSTFIDAIYKELGDETIEACNIPTKDELLSSTKSSPFNWNTLQSFEHNSNIQSSESFQEQKDAINLCCQQIDK